MSSCYVPGSVTGPEDTAVNKKIPTFVELTFWCWDPVGDRKQTNVTGSEMCYVENNLVVDAY